MSDEPRTDIFNLCKIADGELWPMYRQELSRTAGGRTQARDLGPMLWRGRFVTALQTRAEAQRLEAALIGLGGSAGTFTAFDPRRAFPLEYPTGDFDDTGAIMALYGGDAFALRLTGLPPLLQLRAGDYLGFSYGARPSLALHVLREDVRANVAGDTPRFSVYPELRPGVEVGLAVTFRRPSCEMIVEPGLEAPRREGVLSSLSFNAIQIF